MFALGDHAGEPVLRILIVDDSPVDCMVLASAVTYLGHAATSVSGAYEALAVLEREAYDVVLTDWLMPGLSGPELCRRIRESNNRGYTFTVLFTSLNERENGLMAVRAGADKFLTKPVDLIALEMCLITAERVMEMQHDLQRQKRAVEALNAELERQVRTDPLTGVGNRRRLSEDLEALVLQADRYGVPACVVMCDLDRFKAYNDRFGHGDGDTALRAVAETLQAACRDTDRVYRYGGEELVILLPHRVRQTAAVVVERLRAAVQRQATPHPDNQPFGVVTISMGLAELSPDGRLEPDAVLHEADEALYRAKSAGRNRLVVA